MRIREARHDDVPAIVALLADDELGPRREDARCFYPSLGFEAAHDGMKRYLTGDVTGR